MSIAIEHVTSPTDDVRTLIRDLDAELNAVYEPQQRHGFDIGGLFRPGVLFFIAYLDREPAGCGGIAFDDGLAELKRMYVRPIARRRGVAMAIVERLEHEARLRGVTRLTLETGDAQHDALRFYHSVGFTRCGTFGAYATMSPPQIARSIFFEKRIHPSPDRIIT